jgi:hypothetical protein
MTYVSHNEFLNIYENKDKYFSSNNDLHSSILDHIQLKYKKKFKLNTTCKAQFPPGDKFARSEKQISAMYLLSEKNFHFASREQIRPVENRAVSGVAVSREVLGTKMNPN